MKRVSILVVEDATIPSIDYTRGIFLKVNEFLERAGRKPAFDIQLVGVTKVITIDSFIRIETESTLENAGETDLVIIPQVCGDFKSIISNSKKEIEWVAEKYHQGAEVASLCVGAFLLASSGLLDGRKCAMHWAAVNEFTEMFPKVNIVKDRVITDEHRLYTSGGNLTFLNLVLYLIEKFVDREMALFVSKMFQIEINRKSQTPFAIFMARKTHGDELIGKVQESIETNFANKISTEQLCEEFAISRRNLERRFKKATGNTVVEYIQNVKIEVVKKGLESGNDRVGELMDAVDYTDPKSFRRLFKKITGVTPNEYRQRYGRPQQFAQPVAV